MKGRVYASCVRSNMIHGSETRPFLADVGLKLERAEMQMDMWHIHESWLETECYGEEVKPLGKWTMNQ